MFAGCYCESPCLLYEILRAAIIRLFRCYCDILFNAKREGNGEGSSIFLTDSKEIKIKPLGLTLCAEKAQRSNYCL